MNEKAGFYYVVVDAMLKTGFTPHEIGKIGRGSFLRPFGQAVKNLVEEMTMRVD